LVTAEPASTAKLPAVPRPTGPGAASAAVSVDDKAIVRTARIAKHFGALMEKVVMASPFKEKKAHA
jgi:hypothetical protein